MPTVDIEIVEGQSFTWVPEDLETLDLVQFNYSITTSPGTATDGDFVSINESGSGQATNSGCTIIYPEGPGFSSLDIVTNDDPSYEGTENFSIHITGSGEDLIQAVFDSDCNLTQVITDGGQIDYTLNVTILDNDLPQELPDALSQMEDCLVTASSNAKDASAKFREAADKLIEAEYELERAIGGAEDTGKGLALGLLITGAGLFSAGAFAILSSPAWPLILSAASTFAAVHSFSKGDNLSGAISTANKYEVIIESYAEIAQNAKKLIGGAVNTISTIVDTSSFAIALSEVAKARAEVEKLRLEFDKLQETSEALLNKVQTLKADFKEYESEIEANGFDIDPASLFNGSFPTECNLEPVPGLNIAPNSPSTGNDLLIGTADSDRIEGLAGNDTIAGLDGADTLLGGDGDDSITGGATSADLRDFIFGGDGNDTIDEGYGNDELRGGAGNDVVAGGFGSDTVIGGDGDDVLSGGAGSDLIFGGDGFDFINGGFGSDRLNGGAGADRFFHIGSAGHGSDWIQDYSAAEGDVLVYGGGPATARDFLVQIANTPGAGVAGVNEAFVTHIPSGNLLWALVDGDGQTSINIQLGGQVFDLLA